MSWTHSAAAAAAHSASISTPVWCVVSAAVAIRTQPPSRSISRSTATCVRSSGWQSGRICGVDFAAMIPATRAVASTSPFGTVPASRRSSTSSEMRTTARASALRRVVGLSPTSIMRTSAIAA